jgi:hypothetical protein
VRLGELATDVGLLLVGLDAGEDEMIVGDGRLTRIDRLPTGDLVEGVNGERRSPVRRRKQIRIDAQRRPRLQIAWSQLLVNPVRPDDLFRRGHPLGRPRLGPINRRPSQHGLSEFASSDREDPTAAADVLLLRR